MCVCIYIYIYGGEVCGTLTKTWNVTNKKKKQGLYVSINLIFSPDMCVLILGHNPAAKHLSDPIINQIPDQRLLFLLFFCSNGTTEVTLKRCAFQNQDQPRAFPLRPHRISDSLSNHIHTCIHTYIHTDLVTKSTFLTTYHGYNGTPAPSTRQACAFYFFSLSRSGCCS